MHEKSPADALTEPPLVRLLVVTVALSFLCLFLLAPIAMVFREALARGLGYAIHAIGAPAALAAVRLTLLTAAIAGPLNVAFGVVAAWAVSKFSFPGRGLLVSLIDLPFTVSPVISGFVFLLVFGGQGLLGPFLAAHGVHIVFAEPGIILVTVFVSFPYAAREIIPLMEAQGTEEEEAARVLGAGGWAVFWRVTLPNVRWAVIYGAILCNARALGEFGAVAVVSGQIGGVTNTVPLYVQLLYDNFDTTGAFAVAALLVLLAVGTLVAQHVAEGGTRAAGAGLEGRGT